MMWRRKAWLPRLAAAAALMCGGPAAADELDGVMRGLAARRHGEVDFVEQHFLALLKRPAESSGRLIYDAPARLEKRTLEPRAESLILDGDVLTVERGKHTRIIDMKSYPQIRPFVESIRATLAGDRSGLERVFRIRFTGTIDRWTLDLEPLDATIAKSASAIRIDGTHADLSRVEILQADGDRSLMTLRSRP